MLQLCFIWPFLSEIDKSYSYYAAGHLCREYHEGAVLSWPTLWCQCETSSVHTTVLWKYHTRFFLSWHCALALVAFHLRLWEHFLVRAISSRECQIDSILPTLPTKHFIFSVLSQQQTIWQIWMSTALPAVIDTHPPTPELPSQRQRRPRLGPLAGLVNWFQTSVRVSINLEDQLKLLILTN